MSAGQEPTEAAEDDEETKGQSSDEEAPQSEGSPRAGRRRRRKLAELLDEERATSGRMDLMREGRDVLRSVLRGERLSDRGGPAREVNELVERMTQTILALFPTSDPHLKLVRAGNSIEVQFYAPDHEREAAEQRREEMGEEPGPEGLPDTTLAVAALTEIFANEDPDEVARVARSVSIETADQIRHLAAALADQRVELDLTDERTEARVSPERSLLIVERLDAEEELPKTTVKTVGVLQGANSAGEGYFELVSDPEVELDPALGRRRPGDPLRGKLTPRARRQIRDGGLWDSHVEARVEVTRRRKGPSVRVEGLRLVSATARFGKSGS